MKKAIFVGVLMLFFGVFIILGVHHLIAKQSLLPHILEFRGGNNNAEIGLMGLEQDRGSGGIFNFTTAEGEKIRVIWSSVCWEMTKKDTDKFFYFYRYYDDREQKRYLYIYRFYNDTEHSTICVKPGVLYDLTGKIIELRPQEVANLFIKTDLPPSDNVDLKLLEVLQKVKIWGVNLGYRRPAGYPAASSNLIAPSK